jgi:exodeoxyribonuclease VII large subunit
VIPDEKKIYSVSELNRETAWLLNNHFLSIWVGGELSNLSIPASGHCYFTLKDGQAQVRCAMFRSQQRRSFKPENGKQVLVKAQVSLYEPRGDYQLIVEHMEEAGDGALRRAFDALALKLAAEGLFTESRKKHLPLLPKAVGVVTSPTGAAIRDILTVLKRRFPAVPVIIYPTSVQGENARHEISQAIGKANAHDRCDVLIVARGGGALEDLWAFNEEVVARAIAASTIPVISGVGHETDVTIADFVADLRAATPSAAAEHAVPDQQYWLGQFQAYESVLKQLIMRLSQQQTQKLDWLSGRLLQQHPRQKWHRNNIRFLELQQRLARIVPAQINHNRRLVETYTAKLQRHTPETVIHRYSQHRAFLEKRLHNAMAAILKSSTQQFINLSQNLHIVSPLATLNRGYALVTDPSERIIHSTTQIKAGDTLSTRLAYGQFSSIVDAVYEEEIKTNRISIDFHE